MTFNFWKHDFWGWLYAYKSCRSALPMWRTFNNKNSILITKIQVIWEPNLCEMWRRQHKSMCNKIRIVVIKTHGSVSCGTCHTHELLTGKTIMRFSCIRSSVMLQRNQLIFVVKIPAHVITSHSKFQLNRIQDMNLWLSFFVFFFWSSFVLFSSSFCQTTKVAIKRKCVVILKKLS